MYSHIDQFPIDKAANTIVEEGVAPMYIRAYWAMHGKKVQRVRWEVKYDGLWHVTGHVYIELQALEASQADK
jgi:hypothetical protein